MLTDLLTKKLERMNYFKKFWKELVEMFYPRPKNKEEIENLQREREERFYKMRLSGKIRSINDQIESIGRCGSTEEKAIVLFVKKEDDRLFEDIKNHFESRGFSCFYISDERLGDMKFFTISWK